MSITDSNFRFDPVAAFDAKNAEIESLRQQLASCDAEIERLKTVPMRYRRMAFNAQLQNENTQLCQQLAAAQAELEAERNRRWEGNRISSEEFSKSQKREVILRDVVLETKKYLDQTYADLIGNLGAEWLAARIVDHLSPTLSKALAATDDLSGYILCEREPVGYIFQHEDTGRTMCVEAQQVEWNFEKNNPRLFKVGPLYAPKGLNHGN